MFPDDIIVNPGPNKAAKGKKPVVNAKDASSRTIFTNFMIMKMTLGDLLIYLNKYVVQFRCNNLQIMLIFSL